MHGTEGIEGSEDGASFGNIFFISKLDSIFNEVYYTKLCVGNIQEHVNGHNYGLNLEAD